MRRRHRNYSKHQYGVRQAAWGTDEQEDQQPDQHHQPSEAGSSRQDAWHRHRTVVQTQDIWKVPPTMEDWEQEDKVATFAGGLPPTTRSSQEWELPVTRQEEAAAAYSRALEYLQQQSDADPLAEQEENETPAGYRGYYLDQFGYPQTPTLEPWYRPYEGTQYNTPQQILNYSQPQDQYAAPYTYQVPAYPQQQQQQLVTDPKPQNQYAGAYSPVVPVYPQQQLVTDPKPQDQYAAAYSSLVQGLQGLPPRRQQRQDSAAADAGEVQWPQDLRLRRQHRQENVASDEGEVQWLQGLRARRQQRQENVAADAGEVQWPQGSPPTRQSRQENEGADAGAVHGPHGLRKGMPLHPRQPDGGRHVAAYSDRLVDFLLELEHMKEPLDEAQGEAAYLNQDPLWMVTSRELEYAVQRHLYSVAVLRQLIAQREASSSRSWRNASMGFGSSSIASGSYVARGSAVAGDTGVTSNSAVAGDTGVASGSAVAGDTGVASGSYVDSGSAVAGDTGVTSDSAVAGDTGVASGSAFAGDTGVASGSAVAGDTGVASGSAVAGDTGLASDSAVAGDTGVASGSAVAGDTGVASGSTLGRGWVARGSWRGVGRGLLSISRSGRGRHVGRRFTLIDLQQFSPKSKTA